MKGQKTILIIIFFCILLIPIFKAFLANKSIYKNAKITKGIVLELGSSRKNPDKIFFKYKFYVRNVEYEGKSGIVCTNSKDRSALSYFLINRQVPIVYDSLSPNNSEMLFTEKNFKEYGLSFPNEFQTLSSSIDSICTD